MFSDILNSFVQVLAFALIPSFVYLIWFRKKSTFSNFLGLKRANFKANALAAIASLLFLVPPLVLVAVDPEFKSIFADPETVTGKFAQLGWHWSTVISILFIAVIKTSFAEELFFRGFVAKRLIAWIGFKWGNLTQAAIFGLVHLLIFIAITDNLFFILFIFLFSSIGALVSAYLNEKLAEGSIVPGWTSHAVANIGSYTIIGLILL